LWLPASIASRRYGVAVQHLERWRDNPCSFLGGRKIRTRRIAAATNTGTLWVYLEDDLDQIAAARRNPPEASCKDKEGTWLFAKGAAKKLGVRADNLWHHCKTSYPFLPK